MIRSAVKLWPAAAFLVLLVFAGRVAGSLEAQTLERGRTLAETAVLEDGKATGDSRQALPAAAEGEYRWGEAGEVIELYQEAGRLRGYLTRRSERRESGSTPLTFTFDKAESTGGEITFATRRIHGDWYSFTGRVLRGPGRTPREDGYYLLVGSLTTHLGPSSSEEEPVLRQVSLKLSPSIR